MTTWKRKKENRKEWRWSIIDRNQRLSSENSAQYKVAIRKTNGNIQKDNTNNVRNSNSTHAN